MFFIDFIERYSLSLSLSIPFYTSLYHQYVRFFRLQGSPTRVSSVLQIDVRFVLSDLRLPTTSPASLKDALLKPGARAATRRCHRETIGKSWEDTLEIKVFMGKTSINGGFSNKPCCLVRKSGWLLESKFEKSEECGQESKLLRPFASHL